MRKNDPVTKVMLGGLVFVPTVIVITLICVYTKALNMTTTVQKWSYGLLLAVLLAGLLCYALLTLVGGNHARLKRRPVWLYPLVGGLLSLAAISLAYIYLGVWPIGDKSVMTVDMHFQYAPLLMQLRDMVLHGGSPLYTFHAGLGVNFIPLFAYYLASPLNLLLVFFPLRLLDTGILVITILKVALCGAFFTACVQSVFRRRDIGTVIFGVAYALMMYMLAYSWNLMWLDGLFMLPIVIMCFERLMRKGKWLGYILSLAYALFANYYIGFMLCLFLFLYFLVYVFRQKRTLPQVGRGAARFAVASLIGVGLVMFLLLPTYIGLGVTSAAGGKLPALGLNANINMLSLLSRTLYGVAPTIRYGNLPNIACGMLAVLLLPIFLTTKQIPLRRRMAYLGLLLVMALSCLLTVPNLIWHGLHSPNDLPYRFSFLLSFVMLLMAYQVLPHLKHITFKQIGGSLAGLAALLILLEKLGTQDKTGDKTLSFAVIYVSLLFLMLYAVVLALASRKKIFPRAACAFLLVLVFAESAIGGGNTMKLLNSQEYFTRHADYVDNALTAATATAVKSMQGHPGYYRIEYTPRFTCMDPALFNYRGITIFSSSNYYTTTKMMGNLGYDINGVNSFLYHDFVPPVDSLFGLQYVASQTPIDGLATVNSIPIDDSRQFTIYENPDALPLGVLVNPDIVSYTSGFYNPFDSQDTLYSLMTGDASPLYTMNPIADDNGQPILDGNGAPQLGIFVASGSQTFNVPIAHAGHVYIFTDCSAAASITVRWPGGNQTVSPRQAYILDAGQRAVGDQVQVTVTTSGGGASGNLYVATLNDDVYTADIAALKTGGMDVDTWGDSRITGTVNAQQDGVMLMSIPYDDGWHVTVDGQAAPTVKLLEGGLLGFYVDSGAHSIVLTFTPKGLVPGLVISAISLGALVLLLIFTKRLRKRRENAIIGTQAPAAAAAQTDAIPNASDSMVSQADISPPAAAPPPAPSPPPAYISSPNSIWGPPPPPPQE
ncbi:MAG: YfhO family protein [Oscillospiraceae bacterium]|nr:YfhO family protein [Oscillospiraceae bacterium]